MTESIQIAQARDQLRSSVNDAWDDFKNYSNMVINNSIQKSQQRVLKFKEGIKQKSSSAVSKLGQVSKTLVEKLKQTTDKVVDYTATQMANYYNNREERLQQKEQQERMKEAEMMREAEEKARIQQRKSDMKAALHDHRIQQRQEKIMNFKEGIKQKTSSAASKLGQIKNRLVEKLRFSNLDLKFQNMVDKAQIAGLTVASKGKEAYDAVKDYAATQMANYYNNREERRVAKEFQEAARLAEKEEIQRIKEQRRNRKKDVIAALNAQEREDYMQKLQDNEVRKQELLNSLRSESQEEVEEKVSRRAL